MVVVELGGRKNTARLALGYGLRAARVMRLAALLYLTSHIFQPPQVAQDRKAWQLTSADNAQVIRGGERGSSDDLQARPACSIDASMNAPGGECRPCRLSACHKRKNINCINIGYRKGLS